MSPFDVTFITLESEGVGLDSFVLSDNTG